jgi:hypothetical protein
LIVVDFLFGVVDFERFQTHWDDAEIFWAATVDAITN